MKWLLFAVAAALPAVGLAQEPPKPVAQVTTEMPRQGTLPRMLTAYGVIQAAPGGSQTLSVLRAGQVTQINVRTGEAVRRGQALLVITADPASLSAYRQATSALSLARTQRANAAQLLADHLGTRDQLAAADKAVTDAQTTLDTLNREGGGAPAQTLTAAFDGIVSAVPTTPGARVAAQAALLTIDRADQILAAVGVEPGQRQMVAPGQPATVSPLYDGASVPGKVLSASAMLDPTTRLVGVLIAPDTTTALLAGSPVKAAIQVGELTGWIVPRDAVLTDDAGPHVFQVTGDTAHRVGVRIVGTQGGTTVVAGGLDAGRALVTAGNYQLHDGSAVRAAADGAAAGGGR